MEKVKELFVILEDRPNALGQLLNTLAEHKIKIESLGVFVDSAKLSVDNVEQTRQLLQDNKYAVEIRDVIRVRVENTSNELAYITERIGHVGINISHAYGTTSPNDNFITLILDVADTDTALSLFKES